jgi:hypothetical protein
MQTCCSQTLFNGNPRSHLITHFRLPFKKLYFAVYCRLLLGKICHWDTGHVPENSHVIFAPTVDNFLWGEGFGDVTSFGLGL